MSEDPAPIELPNFGGASVRVEADYCLNHTFRQIACTRCRDLCPAAAITLEEQSPALHELSCLHCGACLHRCPTEVFSQSAPPEARLEKSLAALPERTVALLCPVHPDPTLTKTPADVVVRHTRCLAGIGIDDLLTLAQEGQRALWLDDTPCAGCPLGSLHGQIAATAKAVNALLVAGGRPGSITLLAGDAAASRQPVRRPVVDGFQPKLSRRGLFTSFLRTGPTEEVAGTEEAPPTTLSPRGRMKKRFPPKRLQLVQRLRRWGRARQDGSGVTEVPSASVHVDASLCSACQLCARFCPTDALVYSAEDNTFRLGFAASRCVDCGICVVACPEGAVTLHPSAALELVLRSEPIPLVEGPLVACRGCGAPIATRPDAPLCHSCRQGVGIVRPLRDGAGLVADLLRREATFHNKTDPDGTDQ